MLSIMLWIKSLVNLWRNRKRETWTELKEGVTTIMDLPEDVIIDILLRLPVKSVCSIQCVFKTCLNRAGTPDFGTLHTMRLLDSDSVELPPTQFMLIAKAYLRCGKGNLVVLRSFNYNGSRYAWTKIRWSNLVSKICFQEYYSSYVVDFVFCNLFFFKRCWGGPCFLANPLRGEVLKLPISSNPVPTTYSEVSQVDWYGMGFDNITRTYKIVHVLASEKGNYVVAQVLVLGTSSWRQIHLVPPCDVASVFLGSRSCKNGIYACGGMHWLIYGDLIKQTRSHIISFDFNKEQFYVSLLPDSEGYGYGYGFGLNLLHLRGYLAFVNFCSFGGKYVELWVLTNYDEKKWELHHRINGKELQLSNRRFQNCKFTMTCAEWKHGICFPLPEVCYFLDLRYHSMKIVQVPTLAPSIFSHNFRGGDRYTNCSIHSYTESLISLKNYGTLIEATDSKEGVRHIIEV